ncbi:MAG: hypothetical protein HQL50_05650 [Magnetococcales bacterium]|nr:hypothetical protein [Magnetococcales bacterium]
MVAVVASMMVAIFVTAPHTVIADDLLLHDDFNRVNGIMVGNGWQEVAPPEDCESGSAGVSNVVPSGHALFQELTQEIESSGLDGAGKPNIVLPADTTAGIGDHQLRFAFENGQRAQRVSREFSRELVRVVFDIIPLYAMGGMDDRAWVGARITFLDTAGRALGELRHMFVQSAYNDALNTDTVFTRTMSGDFDGDVRQISIPVTALRERFLPGVRRDAIAKTRLSFEAEAGWCGSTLEAAIDNVTVHAAYSPLFVLTDSDRRALFAKGLTAFQQQRNAFPGNWIADVQNTFGHKKTGIWIAALRDETAGDPSKIADLMNRYGFSGKDLFYTGFLTGILVDSQGASALR